MGNQFGGELFALDTGYSQGLAQLRIETTQACLDNALHTYRHALPGDFLLVDPIALQVAAQDAALLKVAHQFRRKEGMAARLLQERLPEGAIKAVGFCIHERIDK